jgi:hypothetical protein
MELIRNQAAAVERREALGPPSVGPRAPEAAILGNGDIAVSARRTPDSGPPKGASSAPWRLPALHPLIGEHGKQGCGLTGAPEKQHPRAAERWLTMLKGNP